MAVLALGVSSYCVCGSRGICKLPGTPRSVADVEKHWLGEQLLVFLVSWMILFSYFLLGFDTLPTTNQFFSTNTETVATVIAQVLRGRKGWARRRFQYHATMFAVSVPPLLFEVLPEEALETSSQRAVRAIQSQEIRPNACSVW